MLPQGGGVLLNLFNSYTKNLKRLNRGDSKPRSLLEYPRLKFKFRKYTVFSGVFFVVYSTHYLVRNLRPLPFLLFNKIKKVSSFAKNTASFFKD